MPRGDVDNARRLREREILRGRGDPIEKRPPDFGSARLVDALEEHRDVERVVGTECRLLAPTGIEETVGVERDEPRDEAAERRIRARVNRRVDDTEEFRQVVRAQRELGHHAERAAAAALQRPEEVCIRAGIGDAHPPIGGDDFGLEERRRGHAVALRKAAEAAALDQAGDAHRRAASALHITAGLGDDRVISPHPDVAGPDSDSRLRRLRAGATLADERVVHLDRVHRARVDEQRARRVRRPLVAVAAALHRKPQPVLAREVDRVHDVLRAARRYRVGTRRRCPAVDPAAGLRKRRAVADVVRVLEFLEHFRARGAFGRAGARRQRRGNGGETTADCLVEAFPRCGGRPRRVPGQAATIRRDRGAGSRGFRSGGERKQLQRACALQPLTSIHADFAPWYWQRPQFNHTRERWDSCAPSSSRSALPGSRGSRSAPTRRPGRRSRSN